MRWWNRNACYIRIVPDELSDFIKAAINDAGLASAYYRALVAQGHDGKTATELTVAWILSRGKKEIVTTEIVEPDKKPWE